MAVNLSFIGGAGWQFFDNDGVPLAGGKIYTYAAGTTTPLATYTSRSGTVANANPIILDAAGRTPQQIWSTEGLLYKYVVADSNDVVLRTWDNIGGSVVASDLAQDLANTSDNAKGDALIGFKQSNSLGFLTGAAARTVSNKLQEIVSVLDFGALGDGVTDDTVAIQAAIDSGANEVLFPEGIYVVSGLTGASNQILNGQNIATLLALPGSTAATTFIAFNAKQNYEVKNFTFDGNISNNTNLNTAIRNDGCSYFSYTNNTWKNCNGISIFIGTSSYVKVNNNTFINCGIYNLTTGVAADRKQAIAFTTCNYAVANDNFFDTVGLDCISFATNCFNVQACRNITKDNYASAIYVSLTTRFVLSDNISYAENVSGFFSGNGLDVINSEEGTISNNVNVNRGSAGITVINCFGITISGNLCKNNNKSGNGAGSGGIVIGTSTAGGFTPQTDNIVATGNVCYDDQGVGAVTQRFGIYKQKQSTSVFNRIVIDTSNNLSGYDSGGNPAIGNAISSTFGLVGYPIEFNLTTGSSLDLCPADVYGVFSVTQLNNPAYYAQVFIRGAFTPILLLDPASQWTAGTGGTKQNVLYDAVSGTIQLQNNTGGTRTYLVTDNRITLAEI